MGFACLGIGVGWGALTGRIHLSEVWSFGWTFRIELPRFNYKVLRKVDG